MSKSLRIYFDEPWDDTITDPPTPEGISFRGPFSKPKGPKLTKDAGGIGPVINFLVFDVATPFGVSVLGAYIFNLFVNHKTKRIRIEYSETMEVEEDKIRRVLTKTLKIEKDE